MTYRRRGRSPADRPSTQSSSGGFGLQPLEARVLLSRSLATPPPVVTADSAPAAVPAAVTAPAPTSSSALTIADRRDLIARLTPGDLSASLSKTLRHSGPDAFDASLLKYMQRRDTARYFFRSKDVPTYLDFAGSTFGRRQQLAAKVALADAVVAHRFPELPGSGAYSVQLGAEIDWDAQPAVTDNPDFLHTLNRHSFWPELALAYRITGKRGYADELASQLRSWADQNPPLSNPNDWPATSPHWWLLDATTRAENWVQTYFFMLGTPGWTAETNTLFLLELWRHGDFLSRVTPGALRSNRTALHATGLLNIAIMLPEFARSADWEGQADSLMFRSLEAQFRPDGGQVEETPAYQGVSVNAFLRKFELAALNGRPAWRRNHRILLTNAVEAYFQFVDGKALPGLSDTYRAAGDPRSFFTQAAAILQDTRYNVVSPDLNDLWVIGLDAIPRHYDPADYQMVDRGPSYALPDSGYYIARGKQTLYFDAGPKGGTHGHYDLLNFELSGTAVPIVADPGPFRYDDSPTRRWAISTPAHNTISVDGLNHAAIEQAHSPAIVVDEFTTTADAVRVTAHHHAYEYLAGRPVVGRTVWVNRTFTGGVYSMPYAIIVDWGQASSAHTFTSSFTLPTGYAPAVQVTPGVVDNPLNKNLKIRLQSLTTAGQTTTLKSTSVSSTPPPTPADAATRYVVSGTGTSYVSVTMISQYEYFGDFVAPPPTLAWESAAPSPGQAARVRLTLADGTTQVLEFIPPNLAPLPTYDASITSPPDVPPVGPPSATSAASGVDGRA